MKSPIGFWRLVIAGTLVISVVATGEYDNAADEKVAAGLRSIPRYNFKLQRVHVDWDPTNTDYLQPLGVIASPFALLAIISLFSICFTLMCCGRCSRRTRTEGVSTGAQKTKIMIALLLVCGAAAFGIFVNTKFHSDFGGVIRNVISTQERIRDDTYDIQSSLQQLNYSNEVVEAELSNVLSQVTTALDDSEKYRKTTENYEEIRNIAIISLFGAVLGLSLFAFFALCSSTKSITIMALLSLLVLPGLLLFCGGNFTASVFVADMCPELDSYIQRQLQELSSDQAAYVAYYLWCEGTTPFVNVVSYVAQATFLAQQALQTAIDEHASQDTIDRLEAIVEELTTVNATLGDLSSCQDTSLLWQNSKKTVCNKSLGQLLLIAGMAFACAILLVSLLKFSCTLCTILRANSEYLPLLDDDRLTRSRRSSRNTSRTASRNASTANSRTSTIRSSSASTHGHSFRRHGSINSTPANVTTSDTARNYFNNDANYVNIATYNTNPFDTPENNSNKTNAMYNNNPFDTPNASAPLLANNVEYSAAKEENMCKICFEQPINSVIDPCGHSCCCVSCGRGLTQCPLCRVTITKVIRIYKA